LPGEGDGDGPTPLPSSTESGAAADKITRANAINHNEEAMILSSERGYLFL